MFLKGLEASFCKHNLINFIEKLLRKLSCKGGFSCVKFLYVISLRWFLRVWSLRSKSNFLVLLLMYPRSPICMNPWGVWWWGYLYPSIPLSLAPDSPGVDPFGWVSSHLSLLYSDSHIFFLKWVWVCPLIVIFHGLAYTLELSSSLTLRDTSLSLLKA